MTAIPATGGRAEPRHSGMKKTLVLTMGLGAAIALVGCGDRFRDCRATHTCTPPTGGSAGASGDGSDPSQPEAGETNGGSSTGGSSVGGSDAAGGTTSPGAGGEPPITTDGGAPNGEGGVPNGGTDPGGSNAGGMAGTTSMAGTGGSGPVADKTPPKVVSVTPTNNAKGVKSDASIVVTWSEPMNKASAQGAFQSVDLAGQVTFAWNAQGTVMTVKPSKPLEYATGLHANLASLAARAYSISLNTSAEDVAGNGLASDYTFKFWTLREVSWSVLASTNIDAYVLTSAGVAAKGDADGGIWVGDEDNNGWRRMALDFGISGIPAAAVGITRASVTASMTMTAPWTGKPLGSPFTWLGKVVLDHIHAPVIDASTLLVEPLRRVGDLATSATPGEKTVDATVAVAEDVAKRASRNNRSQFRAQFTTTTNGNNGADAAFFGYDSSAKLSVNYLVP
jgi:hypothetical protein